MGPRDHELADTVAGDPTESLTMKPAPLAAVMASFEGQTVVGGRFEILGLLGAGGMGIVYKARDTELDEVVALKILSSTGSGDDALERFRREVKLSRRVTHKNVARVFEFGEHCGRPFFTMELVDGESLRARIERLGQLPIDETVRIGVTLARALSAAHEVGVVHRDLKPDNVLVARDGRIAITDFGIAASLEALAARATSSFIGTPHYMAPEQVDGQHPIDERTDIYALGAALFELVTGTTPFLGPSSIAVATARLLRAPRDPRALRSDVPDGLAHLILRCLAKEPSGRFPTAAAVEQALVELEVPMERAVSVAPKPAPSRPIAPLPSAPPKLVRIAVLPLRSRIDPEHAYLAESLTDDLTDALSVKEGLRVASRGLVDQYADRSTLDLKSIRSELQVDLLVDGLVRQAQGEAVELRLRLVCLHNGLQVWANRFEARPCELLGVNDEAAASIARAVAIETQSAERRISDPTAVELYLRARSRYREYWVEAAAEAVRLFDEAVARAPDDGLLAAGHALALCRLAFFDGKLLPRAEAAAVRALEIAPELGESHLAAASIAVQQCDASSAYTSILEALSRAPSLADAHMLLGRVLSETGPVDIAMRSLDFALELDPTNGLTKRERARLLGLVGRWEDAESSLGANHGEHSLDVASRILVMMRLHLWRRDDARLKALRDDLLQHGSMGGLTTGFGLLVSMVAGAIDTGTPPAVDAIASLIEPAVRGSNRRSLFFLQIAAETIARFDDVPGVLHFVRRAAESGLCDLVWMDRCPALDAARKDPQWASLRAIVEARVAPVIERASQQFSTSSRSAFATPSTWRGNA